MPYTTNEIAEACGKSIRSVCGWAQKNNVKREGRFWVFDDDNRAAILEYYGITPVQESNEATAEQNEATEEANEATAEIREAAESIDEADELVDEATEEANEATEPVSELKEVVATFDKSLAKLIDSYEKQLVAKDELISKQNDMIIRLQDDLRAANESNRQLSAGYATEKAADSMERMNAIELAPREEKKKGFAARLKILFTGEE